MSIIPSGRTSMPLAAIARARVDDPQQGRDGRHALGAARRPVDLVDDDTVGPGGISVVAGRKLENRNESS